MAGQSVGIRTREREARNRVRFSFLPFYHSLLPFSLFFLIPSLTLSGDTPTASRIVKNIQENYNRIQDAVIQFSETITMPLSKISKATEGTLYLKKGNKYRIETADKIVITDGKTSWMYSLPSKQVIVDSYRDDQNSISPDKFLLDVPSDYYVVLISSKLTVTDTMYTLRLTPKGDNSFIRSIKLLVTGSWTVQTAEISDMNDTEYIYTVKELTVNSGFPDSEFEFVPPKGTQVVDLRQH